MTGVFTALAWQRRPATLLSVLAACVWLSAGTAHAQRASDSSVPAPTGSEAPPRRAHSESPQSLRRSIVEHGKNATPLLQRQTPGVQPIQGKRERSGWRRFAGGAVGAAGGFFAGGYLGAAIDGDCGGCDDPGLKGALIGMPIGAVLGGIAGALWLF